LDLHRVDDFDTANSALLVNRIARCALTDVALTFLLRFRRRNEPIG
jgi:hypothetical protein